jgi:hypothetical protein
MSFVDENGQRTDDEMAEYWAQYTCDPEYDPADKSSVNKTVSANHAVCVVGYDDNSPKEYFNDPNGTLGGEAGLENPFADVESGAYYYDAVLWAVGNGITDGTSATTFSPEEGCLRAQIVTFLYRAYNGK